MKGRRENFMFSMKSGPAMLALFGTILVLFGTGSTAQATTPCGPGTSGTPPNCVIDPTLTVSKAGAGSGAVGSTPAGIDCGTTCSSSIAPGKTVFLVAYPAEGSVFRGWSEPGCEGIACPLTLTADSKVAATFDLKTPPSKEDRLRLRVEADVAKSENTLNLPVSEVRCLRHAERDTNAGLGKLKAFKCRVVYEFGSDHLEWAYWLPSRQHVSIGISIRSPWYNGDWLVDCRQTETRKSCEQLGGRQMDGCMDRPSDRAYCRSVVYGRVNRASGKAPKRANPQIFSTSMPASEVGSIVNTGGCYFRDGIQPPCAPDSAKRIGMPRFTTTGDSNMTARGQIELSGVQLDGNYGSAFVSVQIKLDGVPAGKTEKVRIYGGETSTVSIERRFFLAEGVHQVTMEATGEGFDHVNVDGGTARLKAFAARPFRSR